MNNQLQDTVRYPALSQSNFKQYLENTVQNRVDPFIEPVYDEKIFEGPSNFKKYVKAARAKELIVDDTDKIKSGETYWSKINFDGYGLPGQGRAKDYCKKWVSYGCNNIKQHPHKQHYAEHTLKSCKTNNCPLCFVDWINRQANRSTRRFVKFTENKQFNFRHIVLSPLQEQAKKQDYDSLKKWLNRILKIANIKTSAVVFHPFRFYDDEKIQP